MQETIRETLAIASAAGGFKGVFARGDRSWADSHLQAHLFDTAAYDEQHRLTSANMDEVIYASTRMLHTWHIPAWVAGRPYPISMAIIPAPAPLSRWPHAAMARPSQSPMNRAFCIAISSKAKLSPTTGKVSLFILSARKSTRPPWARALPMSPTKDWSRATSMD